jgi:5'-3' exonuclease
MSPCFIYTKKNRMLVIIDGDVLCYSACRPRGEAYQRIDSNGRDIYQKTESEYLQESWEELVKKYNALKDRFYASEVLCAVKSADNFRDSLFSLYKANRKNNYQGTSLIEIVRVLRRTLVEQDMAIEAVGAEADDYIRCWANEAKQEYVIASIDKDLKMIPGKHWNIKKEVLEEITPLAALRNYYGQLLSGDPTDNIPGIPKVGPKKAEKAMAVCHTEEEMQEAVVAMYLDAFGPDIWYEVLLANGRLIHLWRWPGDFFNPREWPVIKEML